MTPNDAPSVLRMRRVLRQWSHCVPASALVSTLRFHCRLITCTSIVYHVTLLYSRILMPFRTFSFSNASLIGRLERIGAGTAGTLEEEVESAIGDVLGLFLAVIEMR